MSKQKCADVTKRKETHLTITKPDLFGEKKKNPSFFMNIALISILGSFGTMNLVEQFLLN